MITKYTFQGDWKLKAVEKDADWDQRIKITNSENSDGTYSYPGILESQAVAINGNGLTPWTLIIEHNDGSGAGWVLNELNPQPIAKNGTQYTVKIPSRDTPGSTNPFNDLVIEGSAKETLLIEIPIRPYAVRPDTFQMMPEGIFEAMLGTYYMAVQIKNKWHHSLPANTMVNISQKSRNSLLAGGIQVLDTWGKDELERIDQQVSGTYVVLGAQQPGESRTVYFKLDCAKGEARKHVVEIEIKQPFTPDATCLDLTCEEKIFVSQSGYDPTTKEYYAKCDQGTLYLRLGEMVVESSTLRDVVICAREYRKKHGFSCFNRIKLIIDDLLAGRRVNLCEAIGWMVEECRGNGGTVGWPCGGVLMFPTKFEYRVEPDPAYNGQFGPLPYDDPFWKALLALLALILSIAAGLSAAADIAYQSDDSVIGTLFASKLEKETSGPYKGNYLIDAALCELNGNRSLPSLTPPLQMLDAQSDDEENSTPVFKLDGDITLTGEYLTNVEVKSFCIGPDKTDAAKVENAIVYKSGARTGLTFGLMEYVFAYPRNDSDGVERKFDDQIFIIPIPQGAPLPQGLPSAVYNQAIAKHGDSGSLWIHWKTGKIAGLLHACDGDVGTNSGASRIEDVVNKLNIKFKK